VDVSDRLVSESGTAASNSTAACFYHRARAPPDNSADIRNVSGIVIAICLKWTESPLMRRNEFAMATRERPLPPRVLP
jgi:hypothetical protein